MDQPISNRQPQDDAISQAIARRGQGQQAPMIDQGSSMAPPSQVQAPTQPTQGKQEFVPKDGHEFNLTTLAEALKNDYKLEMEKLKFGSPMMTQV